MSTSTAGRVSSATVLRQFEDFLLTIYNNLSGDNIESVENPAFDLDTFWKDFIDATTLISHESTKLCLTLSKPPLPEVKIFQSMIEKTTNICLTFLNIYQRLPKSKGKTLHKEVRQYAYILISTMKELCAAFRNERELLAAAGDVWEKCTKVQELCKDNKQAVASLCQKQFNLVDDATRELQMLIQDDQNEEAFDDEDPPIPSWTDSDRQVMLPIHGLTRAARACLMKTQTAIRERGNGHNEQAVNELDDIAEMVVNFSPQVDDLIICLTPPVNHSDVRRQAELVKNSSKNLLSIVKESHFFSEEDSSWTSFLEKAVDHNWVKINDNLLID